METMELGPRELLEKVEQLEKALATEKDWTKHLLQDLKLLETATDPKRLAEAQTLVGRLTYLEAKNYKLEEAIKGRMENIQDYLVDCKSPGTRETLENELEYLEGCIKW